MLDGVHDPVKFLNKNRVYSKTPAKSSRAFYFGDFINVIHGNVKSNHTHYDIAKIFYRSFKIFTVEKG